MDTITDGNLDSTDRHSESWTLDALGNWSGSAAITIDGTAQSRSVNAGNQYTAVGGATPAYDNNGNMTTDETGKDYTYDAWNRLVKVDSTQVTYGYTALGQRAAITGCAASTTYSYFSVNWQNLEDDVAGGCGGYSKSTYVWGLGYIDDLVARTDASGSTLYVQQDAAFNVTALINTSSSVVERFVYDPYGQATVLAGNWSTTSDSYNWVYRYKGGRYDTYSGLYNFRYRDYSPTLGRWMQEDPAGYVDGANLYQAYLGAPIGMVDPMGLQGFNFLQTDEIDTTGGTSDFMRFNIPEMAPQSLMDEFGPPYSSEDTEWARDGSQKKLDKWIEKLLKLGIKTLEKLGKEDMDEPPFANPPLGRDFDRLEPWGDPDIPGQAMGPGLKLFDFKTEAFRTKVWGNLDPHLGSVVPPMLDGTGLQVIIGITDNYKGEWELKLGAHGSVGGGDREPESGVGFILQRKY